MTARLQELVSELEPITLEELNSRAWLQRRSDRKYIVPTETVVALLPSLARTHAALEIDGIRSFRYRTVYYDSSALASYRAHVQGRRPLHPGQARTTIRASGAGTHHDPGLRATARGRITRFG